MQFLSLQTLRNRVAKPKPNNIDITFLPKGVPTNL
jgi:hypothetical protein